MNIMIWSLITLLFILSFVGLIYPIIPSVLMVWGGVLLYHFAINPHELTMITWISLGVLTILLFIADYVANLYFVEKAGGSKWGTRAAAIGLIIGSFVLPPVGVIVIPFVLVFLVEIMQHKSLSESLKVAFGTLMAFLSGTFAKGVIQFIMIVIFVIGIWI
ncbi:DUF456 domain-containing protein [Bacillus thuringiensis]|uniref:DUF456 domain-containing protein n=1 Tax=Bacillus thuringiensis TaxID=1428 RepID=UPI0021D67335|nr:DUF456 domain-containing protein [Bacillus thuringiensis]MCU7667745.1 DUF456 domain-containing protein [Bacillus thuringiensis]